jgi:hypothetical protein
MIMDSNIGSKGVVWSVLGGELIGVVFELRYMIIFSFVLILADFWWGHSESMKRYQEAIEAKDSVGMEKYKWQKSRAIRRTANKVVDYVTYLLVGAFLGLAITEPLGWGNHLYAAIVGLGIGCLAEIASIVGHYCYVKFGIEIKIVDVWKWLLRFVVNLFKIKSQIGSALEETIKEEEKNHAN